MRQSVPDVVLGRVAELLAAQPDVKQHEFGKAIGRGGSWVSAFLAGKRHANDIALLVKIARYFGVSVGYLLNEADRGRDAGAMTLLSTLEALSAEDRDVVLQLALSLRRRGAGTGDGEPAGAGGGSGGGAPRALSGALKSRAGKSR